MVVYKTYGENASLKGRNLTLDDVIAQNFSLGNV